MRCLHFIFCCVIATTAPLLAQIDQPFTPDSLTRGLWHFNEVSGSILFDTSGFGNHGFVYGTTIVPGRFGNARLFNGTSDYIWIPSSTSLDFDTSSFRIDVWFKTTHGLQFLLRRGLWSPVGATPGFDINMRSGNLGCELGNAWNYPYPDTILAFFSTATFDDGAWHVATLIRDRDARTVSLYADGNLVAPPHDDPVTFPISSTRPLTIGCWEDLSQALWFNGTIDEVRITCSRQLIFPVGILVTPAHLDFSPVRLPATDSLSLAIRNTGNRDTLRIGSITTGNPHFRVSAESMLIPAGHIDTLRVYYTPSAVQQDTSTLTLSSNDPNLPVASVPLKGRGYTLVESPIIKSISLVPFYYGEARVVWFRSVLDTAGSADPITEYSLWRRVDRTGVSNEPSRPPSDPSAAQSDALWDFLGTVPAVQFDEYSMIEPMVYDYYSINPWSVYIVASHTQGGRFYFSDPDSLQYYGTTSSGGADAELVPREFRLHQNYPNPFNPTTTLSYDLPHDTYVSLRVYDILGREVTTLVNQRESAGTHSVLWNGDAAASGIYFYRLETSGVTFTKKMLLVK